MFLFGVVVFALASATIGFAPSDSWLVASRAVQGIGAAFMMPGTLSIISNAFPPEERGKAIGTWAGVLAIALAVGPVLGGWLTEEVSWRAIFFLNLPVAVGAVAVTLFAAHESRDETVGRSVDIPGIALLTTTLTALVFALVEGNAWGWGSPGILGAARRQRRRPAAFVASSGAPPLRWSTSRRCAPSSSSARTSSRSWSRSACWRCSSSSPSTCRTSSATSPLEAGIRFLPSTLVIIVAGPVAGRLADRVGPRPLMVAGLLIVAASLVLAVAYRGRHELRLPGRRVRAAWASAWARDVADEHGGDERGRPHQGRRRLRHALDVPHGRRHVRRRRAGRARRGGRPPRPRAVAPQVPAGARDALVDGLGSGAGLRGRAAAGRRAPRTAAFVDALGHRADDQRGRGRARRGRGLVPDRAGPRRGRPLPPPRPPRPRRSWPRSRALRVGGAGYGPAHPFDRQTPPPHGGVSNRPPMRRNWSFMSRASCVRRGNSCGSWPAGGAFAIGGTACPAGSRR